MARRSQVRLRFAAGEKDKSLGAVWMDIRYLWKIYNIKDGCCLCLILSSGPSETRWRTPDKPVPRRRALPFRHGSHCGRPNWPRLQPAVARTHPISRNENIRAVSSAGRRQGVRRLEEVRRGSSRRLSASKAPITRPRERSGQFRRLGRRRRLSRRHCRRSFPLTITASP